MKIIIENRTKLSAAMATFYVHMAMEYHSIYGKDELRAYQVTAAINPKLLVSSITNKQSIRYVIWEKQHEKIT